MFIFNAYTTKLQVVSADISRQPQYNLEDMQNQMNDISKFIIEHKEFEDRHKSNADQLSKQIKELQLGKLREPTNRKEYAVPPK
jgi:peptidoglycan hydrolase CwlO-like protein